MKKRACIGLMLMSLFVSLAAATSASAQSLNLNVDVPFDFYVGDKQIPAGEYTVTSTNDDGSLLRIRSTDGRESAIFLTNAVCSAQRHSRPARLVFNKYADQHFLTAVWENTSEGRGVRAAKRERNLRKELYIAGSNANAPGVEIVTIVARLDKR